MELQPWTRAMVDVLSDRGWHPIREVWDAGAAHVPPGVAHRSARRPDVDRPAAVTEDIGRRTKAQNVLRALIRSGTVERRRERVRLRRDIGGVS